MEAKEERIFNLTKEKREEREKVKRQIEAAGYRNIQKVMQELSEAAGKTADAIETTGEDSEETDEALKNFIWEMLKAKFVFEKGNK